MWLRIRGALLNPSLWKRPWPGPSFGGKLKKCAQFTLRQSRLRSPCNGFAPIDSVVNDCWTRNSQLLIPPQAFIGFSPVFGVFSFTSYVIA